MSNTGYSHFPLSLCPPLHSHLKLILRGPLTMSYEGGFAISSWRGIPSEPMKAGTSRFLMSVLLQRPHVQVGFQTF